MDAAEVGVGVGVECADFRVSVEDGGDALAGEAGGAFEVGDGGVGFEFFEWCGDGCAGGLFVDEVFDFGE